MGVATDVVAPVGKGRQCSGPEEYFCRLIAYEGRKPTQAYRIAWKGHKDSAHDLAPRVMARPHVIARLAEMRAAADREGQMAYAERRRLLAETARSVPKSLKASHSDRIAAIREDAILAGERRTDGTQLNISVDVTAVSVVGALRAAAESVAVVDVQPVSEPAVATRAPEAVPALPAVQNAAGEPQTGVCGPLGAWVPLAWDDAAPAPGVLAALESDE